MTITRHNAIKHSELKVNCAVYIMDREAGTLYIGKRLLYYAVSTRGNTDGTPLFTRSNYLD